MQHQRIMGGASSMERGERSLAMQAFSVDSRTSSVRKCNPQCFFQVHEFTNTDHYLATLAQTENWLHAQVGHRPMALTFNGCMMHYDFDQSNASERAQYLIAKLKEAAKWYDNFLELKIEN